MTVNVTDSIFNDEDKARAYFEAIRWPDGVTCCHCGNTNIAIWRWRRRPEWRLSADAVAILIWQKLP
jgi:hypothetical protein